MFLVQQRKSSICQTVLLIVLLELTFVEKSISNQKTCGSRNTRSISYFKLDDVEVNWNEAWRLCNNRSSTLPVICDQHEQDTLTNYLKANTGISAAWTSGRKIKFNEWKWVDGQPFNNRSVIPVQHELYTHVLLNQDRNYVARDPRSEIHYLCQYSDSSCNSENVIYLTQGCVKPSDDDRTWYDARNQCLMNGSDLAILTDADLVTLRRSNKLDAAFSYWIGLRNIAWHWKWQTTVPSGDSAEEVKYTNWPNDRHSLYDDCISIDASNGGWNSVRCTDRKKVVCQARLGSDATTSSETTSIQLSTASSSPLSSSPTPTELLASFERGSPSVSYPTFTAVVIVGLCVIVISNIIVALVVRKYIYRRANAAYNSEATEPKCYQDLEMTQMQANPDGTYTELQLQPVYEEVSKRGH